MAGFETISADSAIQAAYERIRATGESHALAEMLALAHPPGATGTERAFLQGRCNGSQFAGQEAVGQAYAEDAEAAGVNTKGRVYVHGLATYPGDPGAWIAGRDDAERIIAERGWGAEGSITAPVRAVAEPTGGGVSESLVDEYTEKAIAAAPEPVKDVAEVRAQVKERLMPYWAKK
jgi:hypothetical protein